MVRLYPWGKPTGFDAQFYKMIKINFAGNDYYAYFAHIVPGLDRYSAHTRYCGRKPVKPVDVTTCFIFAVPEGQRLTQKDLDGLVSVALGTVRRSVHDKPNRKVGNFQAFKKAVFNLVDAQGLPKWAIEVFIQEYHAAHKPRPQVHPLAFKVQQLQATIIELEYQLEQSKNDFTEAAFQ